MTRELLISPLLSAEACTPWTTREERLRAEFFATPGRRAEYLTWRTLVRRRLGADVRIVYDETGAPVLPERREFLSVAHCPGRVVVCLCDEPCAVDVESSERDFRRVLERVASPGERILSADPRWPGVLWCAKEALYKYARHPGADFARDLLVSEVDFAGGTARGMAFGERVPLTLRFDGGFTIVSAP